MKKICYTLLLIAATLSCKKDDTLRYNNVTMGNIDGETIISDQGNIFNISESLFEIDFKDLESDRVMLSCDVLKETAEKTYDIRLTGIREVLTKNIKTMADSTPEEDLATDDPIVIRQIWYSGGYLNMMIDIAVKRGSETSHYINLVMDEAESGNGKYTFTLRHNAQGERPSENDDEYYSSPGYVSFPLTGVVNEDSAQFVLNWTSFKYMGSWYSLTETEKLKNEYNWTRGGHEHAPAASALKSCTVIE